MGQWYAQCFSEYSASELVAICDIRGDVARDLASVWSVPATYDSASAMLQDERLDAVAVATPDSCHTEPVIAALDAGCHVLCEKPLATTLDDGLAIREAVMRSGKELMVNFGNRRRPRVQALRRAVLEQGAIGELGNAYVELNERVNKAGELTWMAESSPIWFLMSHCVDTLRFVTGLEIDQVFGYETVGALRERGIDTSDTAAFVAELSNGGRAFLGASWVFPESFTPDIDFRLRLLGTRGLLDSQMHPHDVRLYAEHAEMVNYSYSYSDHAGRRDNWWFDSTRYFVHCLATGTHPTPDVDDGLRCLRVLLAMEESIRTNLPVGVDYGQTPEAAEQAEE
jgi:predicted dehydrogenase